MGLGKQWAIAALAIVGLTAVPREAAAFWDWIHELSGPSMMGIGYTCRVADPATFGRRTVRYNVTAMTHGLSTGSSVTIASRSFGVTYLNDDEFTIDIPARIDPITVRTDVQGKYPGALILVAPAFSFDRCLAGTQRGLHNISERYHWWVRYQSFFYYSVKHEDDPDGPPVYAFTHGGLFEVSPVHPGTPGKSVFFYGAGVECFRFWSGAGQFDAFERCAAKFRPFAVRINPPEGQRILGLKALEVGLDTRYFPRGFVPRDFGVNIGPEERDGGEWTVGLFFSAVLR